MANQQYIRCPDCDSQIPFDPYALIRGERFACPKCPNVSIGMAPESRGIVKDSLTELENLKKEIESMKSESPSLSDPLG